MCEINLNCSIWSWHSYTTGRELRDSDIWYENIHGCHQIADDFCHISVNRLHRLIGHNLLWLSRASIQIDRNLGKCFASMNIHIISPFLNEKGHAEMSSSSCWYLLMLIALPAKIPSMGAFATSLKALWLGAVSRVDTRVNSLWLDGNGWYWMVMATKDPIVWREESSKIRDFGLAMTGNPHLSSMVPRLETGSPIKGNGQKPCNMPPSLQGNYLAKTSRGRFDGTALLQFKVVILALVYFAQSWYWIWISSKKIARHMIIS